MNKRLPYGISNFKYLIEDNYIYIDKTEYLEKLENFHSPYIIEIQIEISIAALERFGRNRGNEVIIWVDRKDGSFWVIPRNLSSMLDKHLFQKKLPEVSTSGTWNCCKMNKSPI